MAFLQRLYFFIPILNRRGNGLLDNLAVQTRWLVVSCLSRLLMIPDRVFDEFVDVILNFQSTDSIEKEGTDIFSTNIY